MQAAFPASAVSAKQPVFISVWSEAIASLLFSLARALPLNNKK
jgi:hypothetical protein